MPANLPGRWQSYERAQVEAKSASVVVANGFIANDQQLGDAEISFRLRAPEGTSQLQAWAGFRVLDEDHRYVVGLRGGNNNHLYLARYAPEARAALLGLAPLDFKPQVGEWYQLRIVTLGKRIMVFLGSETLPRINVEEADPIWEQGGVALGGGYLSAEFSDLKVSAIDETAKGKFAALKDQTWATKPALEREKLRATQRAAYKPLVVSKLADDRTEISLDGNWLFMPDQQLEGQSSPATPDYGDNDWHVLDVPNFWTPTLAWLNAEELYPKMKGVGGRKGVSDKAYLQEMERLDGYTFDWQKTQGGWYRHQLQLPETVAGRKAELVFDAIAKVSEVWVNGKKVGSHVGMFGEVRCDISAAVKPGNNLLAVHVLRNPAKQAKAEKDKLVGIAVTVEITDEMLKSLPRAMYGFDPGGIWQPVKLVVTAPFSVRDVFIKPQLDSAEFEVELHNAGPASDVKLGYCIRSVADGSVLVENPSAKSVSLPEIGAINMQVATPKLAPKLWSPDSPNLYELELQLSKDGTIVDRKKTRFGFRTFTTQGNQFLLNGKPYWLRGAGHFPLPLKPNDAALADKFLRLSKAGNVEATRTHVAPLTETWAEAADRLGMLISFEGIWPWLMLHGDVPAPELLEAWRNDFAALIRKYRNRPSVVLWTVNNEMKFYIFDRSDNELLKRKWAVVSGMIKQMRALDPTRPIVGDSGYVRKENQKGYEEVVKPNGFDDGDVDDSHRYYSWYDPSFTSQYDGDYGRRLGASDRPLISQEMSTGYPRIDDGLPTRSYLFSHYTPQAFVGQYAYEHNDPAYFLKRQAFNTKQLAEVLRRANHAQTAGVLHFAYLTWFKDCFDVNAIEPFPTYYSLKEALSPVLVSAELFGWHYFAGAKIAPRVCVVNDARDGQAIGAGELQWSVTAGGKTLTKGSQLFEGLAYYQTKWSEVPINMPEKLSAARTEARLEFKLLADGKLLAENGYDITLASRDWSERSPKGLVLYDPQKNLPASRVQKLTRLETLEALTPQTVPALIVAQGALTETAAQALSNYLQAGGRALLLNPGALVTRIAPQIKGFRALKDAEIVTFNRPGSPAFDGLEPLDLSWFYHGQGKRPVACTGVYSVERKEVDVLAEHCQIHGYLQQRDDIFKYLGVPLAKVKVGKGTLVASEMALTAWEDPVAQRLFSNLMAMVAEGP